MRHLETNCGERQTGPLGDPDADGLNNLQQLQLGSSPVRPNGIKAVGAYKNVPLASSLTSKAYDVYYRQDLSHQWRRISSGVPGQGLYTFVNPNPAAEGDYIFLDAADDDGDGLSNGYEYWFTYSGQRTSPALKDWDGDGMQDGWEVAHGISPVDGSRDPGNINGPNYVVPGDSLTALQKHTDYYDDPKGYNASYDPLKLTASSSIRPVVTIAGGQISPSGDVASFTITRDAGQANSLANDLTVYYGLGGTFLYGRDYLVDPAPQTTTPSTDGYPRVFLAKTSRSGVRHLDGRNDTEGRAGCGPIRNRDSRAIRYRSAVASIAMCAVQKNFVGFVILVWPLFSVGQGTIRITFDGPPLQPPGSSYNVQNYYESGMWFRPLPGTDGFGRSWTNLPPGWPDNGTPYLNASFGESLVFSCQNDSPFGMTSVDLAAYSGTASNFTVSFVGFRSDGSSIGTSFSGSGLKFQTYDFGSDWASGLTRVEIPYPLWSLDNLVLSIPEPTSGALLACGSALAVWRNRRQRP